MVGDWFDQNDPANGGADPFPTQPQPSGDGYSGPTWDPNAQGQNTGTSGYGFGNGVPTPPITSAPGAAPTYRRGMSPEEARAFITQYYASKGVTPRPTSIDYFVSKWPELEARGLEIGNPNYAMDRLAAAEEFGGSWPSSGGAGGYDFGAGTKPYKEFTLGDFTKDPGYQFTLGQGLQAIDRRKAAQGGLLTGGTDKARANYATGLANQTFNDFYNRSAGTYDRNQSNYFTGLNSAFDKWYRTTQLGANAAAQ